MGFHIALGGGGLPVARVFVPDHTSYRDNVELVGVDQIRRLQLAMQQSPYIVIAKELVMSCKGLRYQDVFLKENVTYLSNKCVVLVKLDPRDKLAIFWICSVVRHIFICSLGRVKVVVIEKTGGILTIFK